MASRVMASWRRTATGWVSADGRWRVRGPIMGKLYWIYRVGVGRYTPTGRYEDCVSFRTAAAARHYAETIMDITRLVAVVGVLGIALTGCTHWRHVPPVTLEQQKLDLRACLGAARGLPSVVIAPTDVTAVTTAVSGAAFAVTIVEEVQFERRLEACMQARGYRRAGLTTNPYGWVAQ